MPILVTILPQGLSSLLTLCPGTAYSRILSFLPVYPHASPLQVSVAALFLVGVDDELSEVCSRKCLEQMGFVLNAFKVPQYLSKTESCHHLEKALFVPFFQ